MARLWRVHAPELPAVAGSRLTLDPDEAHHVHKVLRLRPGEQLAVFDGRGAEWLATLVEVERGGVTARLEREIAVEVEPPLRVVLFQALCRPEQMEWVIRKATEVGVSAIRPLRTERSERYEIGAARLERWRRIATDACKQSGRRVLPAIESRADLPRPTAGATALVLDPEEPAPPLASVFEGGAPREVWLASGPAMGFDAGEREGWSAAGWRPVALGPRTLRADTAGLVAATILLHRWADLGS